MSVDTIALKLQGILRSAVKGNTAKKTAVTAQKTVIETVKNVSFDNNVPATVQELVKKSCKVVSKC
jgi:hypothetical protein